MKRYSGIREIKKGEVYEISYYPYPGAKRKQFRVSAVSEQEAFLIRAKHIGNKEFSGKEKLTFAEVKEQFRLKCLADGNSPKTILNLMSKYRNIFEVFMPQYHPNIADPNQITKTVVEDYKQFVVVHQRRQHGWRDDLTKLKLIYSKLIAIGICRKGIYDDVLKQFKRPKRRVRLYREVTKDQMKQLLDFIRERQPHLYGPTYMIMRLGWRRGQVLSLKRRNVKVQDFRPIQIVCEPQDTKNKEPFILRDIDNELARVVQDCLFDGKESEWLFCNKKGNRISPNHYTTCITNTSQKVLGFSLNPHSFRHNFCTQRLREGAVERDIMAITGHKDPESFRIYVHATSVGTKQVLNNSKIF